MGGKDLTNAGTWTHRPFALSHCPAFSCFLGQAPAKWSSVQPGLELSILLPQPWLPYDGVTGLYHHDQLKSKLYLRSLEHSWFSEKASKNSKTSDNRPKRGQNTSSHRGAAEDRPEDALLLGKMLTGNLPEDVGLGQPAPRRGVAGLRRLRRARVGGPASRSRLPWCTRATHARPPAPSPRRAQGSAGLEWPSCPAPHRLIPLARSLDSPARLP